MAGAVGLLALLVVGGLVGWRLRFWGGQAAARGASDRAPALSKADSATPEGLAGDGVVELRDLRLFTKDDTDTAVYFVGELTNVTDHTVAQPRATIVLLDEQRQPRGEGSCDALVVFDLEAGGAIPCAGVVSGAAGFASHRVTTSYAATDPVRRAAELKLSKVDSSAPKERFGAHRVTGEITNRSNFDAQDVWVIVGLYGDDGKIVGAGRTTLADGSLAAGGRGDFSVSVFNVSGKSKTSRTLVFGYARP